jgi:hypothetical protein
MNIFSVIKSIILWSYERGSWQYDVLAVVILAFIFLTPNEFLDERHSNDPFKNTLQTQRTYISTNEITSVATANPRLNDLLTNVLSKRYQRNVTVKRIEIDTVKTSSSNPTEQQDSDLVRGYRVWFE